MAVLAWKHGTTRSRAHQLIESRLQQTGHGRSVNWQGDSFTSSIGWGVVLDLAGRIDDEFVVLDKSRGAMGGIVLTESEAAFEQMFPGGKQSSSAT